MANDASSVEFRRATSDAAANVADLLIRARKAATGTIPPAVHSDAGIREWVAGHLVPSTEVWMAAGTDDHLLAVMALNDGWIDQLYVDPGWTGQGLGSRLVELAKSRSPRGLQLWTFVSNVGAQRFYERHGFVVAEATDGSGERREGA